MILSFSTQINDKPTYFVDKIIAGLVKNSIISISKASELLNLPISKIARMKIKSKIHSIRKDKNDKWKPGIKIHFFINSRRPNMFRFAPVISVVSTQKIEIKHSGGHINTIDIYIDDECYVQNYGTEYNMSNQREMAMLKIANNDGFDTIEDFISYFKEDFSGKIIHWTNLKY